MAYYFDPEADGGFKVEESQWQRARALALAIAPSSDSMSAMSKIGMADCRDHRGRTPLASEVLLAALENGLRFMETITAEWPPPHLDMGDFDVQEAWAWGRAYRRLQEINAALPEMLAEKVHLEALLEIDSRWDEAARKYEQAPADADRSEPDDETF